MKHPLASVALLFIAGILLADNLQVGLGWWLMICGIVAGVAWFGERIRIWLLPVVIVVTGASNLAFHKQVLSPVDLRMIVKELPALAEIRGRLVETPLLRIYESDARETVTTLVAVRVEALRVGAGDWRPAHGTLATKTPGEIPITFVKGAPVTVSGLIDQPPGPLAQGLFDYRKHLERRGIYFQLRCNSLDDWRLEGTPGPGISERFIRWSQNALRRGLPTVDQPLELLWAMTLGWRTGLSGEVAEPFMRSGTMHVFAISGLHVVAIAWILLGGLRMVSVPRHHCALIIIPLIWFYTAATGWQASAARSALMASVIYAGWVAKRPSNLLNSLAAAAVIILLWDPLQLFQGGFLLSFGVVLSLALVAPLIGNLHGPFWEPDSMLPRLLHRWWMQPGVQIERYVRRAIITSVAAFVGSAPLIAAFFNLITPVSVAANLVVVPLSTFALASSMVSLLVTPVWPWGAEIFNHASWGLMKGMVISSEWFARLPWAFFHVPTPGFLLCAVYYAALLAWLCGWFRRPRLKWWLAGSFAALALAGLARPYVFPSAERITVLPLTGSHAVYVEAKQDWLFDCGTDLSVKQITRPFLATKGINQINNLILTHGDAQHVKGVVALADAFRIGNLWTPTTYFRSGIYRKSEEFLAGQAAGHQKLSAGTVVGPWRVLHPSPDDKWSRADDGTLVLLGQFPGSRILLLSDLGEDGQEALLKRTDDLRADIVVFGWPQQGEPLNDALLEAIGARMIIMAEPPTPFSQRRIEILRERVTKNGVELILAHETGAVTFERNRGKWRLSTMRPIQDEPPAPQQTALAE